MSTYYITCTALGTLNISVNHIKTKFSALMKLMF